MRRKTPKRAKRGKITQPLPSAGKLRNPYQARENYATLTKRGKNYATLTKRGKISNSCQAQKTRACLVTIVAGVGIALIG